MLKSGNRLTYIVIRFLCGLIVQRQGRTPVNGGIGRSSSEQPLNFHGAPVIGGSEVVPGLVKVRGDGPPAHLEWTGVEFLRPIAVRGDMIFVGRIQEGVFDADSETQPEVTRSRGR